MAQQRSAQLVAASDPAGISNPSTCVFSGGRCQQEVSAAGSGVSMPSGTAEQVRWYKKLRSKKLTESQLAGLATKSASHRLAEEHFRCSAL
jgi:hypothetical protein